MPCSQMEIQEIHDMAKCQAVNHITDVPPKNQGKRKTELTVVPMLTDFIKAKERS